jgi:hypothetical protein
MPTLAARTDVRAGSSVMTSVRLRRLQELSVKRRRSYSASLSGFIESDEEAGARRADVRTR